MTSSRFRKQYWLRQLRQLQDDAEFFSPGKMVLEQELQMTYQQRVRHSNRYWDFEAIQERAQLLRDALATLRP